MDIPAGKVILREQTSGRISPLPSRRIDQPGEKVPDWPYPHLAERKDCQRDIPGRLRPARPQEEQKKMFEPAPKRIRRPAQPCQDRPANAPATAQGLPPAVLPQMQMRTDKTQRENFLQSSGRLHRKVMLNRCTQAQGLAGESRRA